VDALAVVRTTPAHGEVKALARGCLTQYHSHHYLGLARTHWQLFAKGRPRQVKPLLDVSRVLLTSIHVPGTGAVAANLVGRNDLLGLAGHES
jgi:predicted nucleotidyltransferase